jgi:DNA-binding protein H-NS
MAKGAVQEFEKMTIEELEAAIREAASTLEQKRQQREDEIIAQVRALTAQIGKTPEELFGRRARLAPRLAQSGEGGGGEGGGGDGGEGAAAPKYRHPGDPALTWSGRGKRPQWVAEALAGGKTLDDLAVS